MNVHTLPLSIALTQDPGQKEQKDRGKTTDTINSSVWKVRGWVYSKWEASESLQGTFITAMSLNLNFKFYSLID